MKIFTCFSKHSYLITAIIILPIIIGSCIRVSTIEITKLKCEYLENPLGMDEINPRFSWGLISDERNQKQTAYQIIVSSSKEKSENNEGDIWDTEKVDSDQSIQIPYQGSELKSATTYYWKVKIWDSRDRLSPWSNTAKWSMGFLKLSDWRANWIGMSNKEMNKVNAPDDKDEELRGVPPITPSPMLRKTFFLNNEPDNALVYVTALGLYELYLNGEKVGNRVLAPEWTDYTKRIQYQTYDVSELLRPGENVIGAVLADGWYIGTFGQWGDDVERGKNYGSLERKFLLQMEINSADGEHLTVLSDESWKGFTDGPVRCADMFLGETVDDRKTIAGWNDIAFDDSGWLPAESFEWPEAELVAQMNEPIRIIDTLNPIALTEPEPGVYIFNMGQNMVGWCQLLLDEEEGTKITLRHGEMLTEEGGLYNQNLRRADQEDVFITSGTGPITMEPRFTYHGFQYVEITGLTRKPGLEDLSGIAISSDTEPAGRFECSNPELNQLWKNILWTQRDNQHSIPTDCPQRDERMGWMGDAQVFSQTAIFNMNMAAFYSKWCQDIRDAQSEEGHYADFAPHPNRDKPHLNAPGWADAGIIVPWRVYVNYADLRILEQQYHSARKFIDFVHSENPDLVWRNVVGNNYGDWLNGDRIESEDYPGEGAEMPKDAFATAYFAYSTRILAKMAGLLGYDQESQRYSLLADSIREVFNQEFVTDDGKISGDTQAGYAIALDFKLLPDSLQKLAVQHMVERISDYDGRISTGFHSTILLMKELTDWGYTDLAYKLLESHRFPSWLYSIDQGATTIWERWDAYVKERGFQDIGMNSFNHYTFGSVAEWMYRTILGINPDDQVPGFKKFRIIPEPGGSLEWAKGEYQSLYGKIHSEWEIENNQFYLSISIPVNTSAEVHIPSVHPESIMEGDGKALDSPGVRLIEQRENKAIYVVGSGRYEFKSDFQISKIE